MATNSPDTWKRTKENRERLKQCWAMDIDWSLFPLNLKKGCEQVGQALNIPATAVLSGYIILGSFVLSPSMVKRPTTDWEEPTLVWLTVCMPTGSGKSTLFRHLYSLLRDVRAACNITDKDPSWVFDDATFEKMGAIMHENSGRLLGIYDELSAFLTKINLYRGRGLSDSHELALFLALFNGHPWIRDTVSGEANFSMPSTNLTVGGFTQPGTARSLIDIPANTEKGLSQRFLWHFPAPLYEHIESLGHIDREFMDKLRNLLARQWRGADTPGQTVSPIYYHVSPTSATFNSYYNGVQDSLKAIAGMDEFLEGVLSKSRGQVFRLSVVMHMLFHIDKFDQPLPVEIDECAIKAAVNFVQLTCQQTLFIAGKGKIEEELDKFRAVDLTEEIVDVGDDDVCTAGYCLSLPGRTLYLTPLLAMKKFRRRGNKDGAIRAFYRLEEDGLGKVLEISGSKGILTQYEFQKEDIPESKDGRLELAKKLKKYRLSLTQYGKILEQREIKPIVGVKRSSALAETPTPRKSPRSTPQKSLGPSTPRKSPRLTPRKLLDSPVQ